MLPNGSFAAPSDVQSARTSRVITALFIVAGLAGLGVSLHSAWTSGTNWDARVEIETYQSTKEIDPEHQSLAQAYAQVPKTLESYGVLFWKVAEALHSAFSDGSPLLASDPTSYHWFAPISLTLSLLAATLLGLVVTRVLQSAPTGAFAFALLLTTPLWAGHSAMNYKDTGVAAGLTLVACGLVLFWVTGNRLSMRVLSVGAVALGATTALGVRGSSFPIVAVVAGGTVVILGVQAAVERAWRRWALLAGVGVVGLIVALVVTRLTNPFAQIDMASWLAHSFGVAKLFPALFITRTAGFDAWSIDLPWWYLPAWLFAQLPLASGAILLLGIATFAVSLIRRSTRWTAWPLTPLLIQGAALPAVVLASRAPLYDGIRHLLFMIPGLVMLQAFGIWYLARAFKSRKSTWVRHAPVALALLVTGLSLLADLRWAPYQYAYVNPVAAGGESRRWELDYWGLSAREGIETLRGLGQSSIFVLPSSAPGWAFGALEGSDLPSVVSPGQAYGLYSFMRSDPTIPEGCTQRFEITRDGLVIGQGFTCRAQ